MLTYRFKCAVKALYLTAAVVLFAGASWAQTAKEPFVYTAGGSPGNGGSGWAGPWVGNSALVVAPGLTHPSLAGSGNALGRTPGSAATRMLTTPIVGAAGTSLVLRALVRSDVEGTPASQATLGNADGGTFIIGDLPQQDAQATNWGLQNAAAVFYSTVPVAANTTTLLVAQIDFDISGSNDRMRLWIDPPPGSHLAAKAAIDVTNANVTSFSGVFWQTQQNQVVDEITIEVTTKCTSEHLITAGSEDGFTGGVEPANPGSALLAAVGSAGLNFGQIPGVNGVPTDQRFAHTLIFSDLAAQMKCGVCEIVGARLRIGLKAAPPPSGGLASNDSLRLSLAGTTFKWSQPIGLPSSTSAIVSLDLAALPSGSVNILGDLADGRLEVDVQDDTGVDFVTLYVQTACDCTEIHGSKFYDRNENGVRDPGDGPLAGWTFELHDQSGSLLGTATTDSTGAYSFTNVPPGTNTVQEVPQSGWHVTQPASGVAVVTSLPGELVEGVDFGNSDLWCGRAFNQWAHVVMATPGQKAFGGSQADLMIGTSGDDWLKGNAGDDCIYGLGGNDYLKGDSGNDEMHGGAGDDYLKGDSGRDRLYGGDGNDKLKGDSGLDEAHGGSGNDFLMGDAGDDNLFAEEGDDRLCGNAGDDLLDGGPGSDGGRGGGGNDTEVSIEYGLTNNECNASSFNAYPL